MAVSELSSCGDGIVSSGEAQGRDLGPISAPRTSRKYGFSSTLCEASIVLPLVVVAECAKGVSGEAPRERVCTHKCKVGVMMSTWW